MPKVVWRGHTGVDFPPDIGGIAWKVASSVMTHRLPTIMRNTEKLLKGVTPEQTGLMKSMVRSWDARTLVNGGWSFYYGWRKTEWPTSVFYPEYVLGGTGLYGPRHTPIVPVTAPFLVWKDSEGSVYVKRAVKGQHPQNLFGAIEGDVGEMMSREMHAAMLAGFKSIRNTKTVIRPGKGR